MDLRFTRRATFQDGQLRKDNAVATSMQCNVLAGLGNPYVHLRLGQAYFELGNFDKSADELSRAYMGAGMDIFMEDDGKYLEFLETREEL